ncbi:MAG: molybdenum cofactor biosysynthesis protein [Verrucomicrobia bacterium]|nr:molybdenum cofactor biosysynthesis protein [Verrucomicrobiota bacterium]
MRIRHLFLSPGHNYFGRHEKPPGEHPIVEVEELECVAGRGIVGDRFLDFKPDYRGQITFFAWEILERMREELGLAEAAPSAARRNVITEGVDLNTLIGKEFELQGVRFAGTEECRPCHWMNCAFGSERTESWLHGNGGLRARILTDGVLRRDTVAQASWLPSVSSASGS